MLEESRQAPPVSSFLPMLLKGAGVTVLISVSSMGLAILLGLALTLMRLYAGPPFDRLATAYIEVYRGTPLHSALYTLLRTA